MIKYFINSNIYKDTKNIENRIRLFSEENGLLETYNVLEANLIISIGGDGTFIDSAKKIIDKDIEIFGINKGTLGFLTDINEINIEEFLKKYINKEYFIEERMLLNCIFKKNNILANKKALNDIVLSKKDSNIIGIDIYVKNRLLNSFYGDGLIISTPTGSTGYSLSCGGPIVDPLSDTIILTPIAPHSMINRSIILSPTDIRIQLVDTKKTNTAKLSIDGIIEDIHEGEYFAINKSNETLKIVKFDENNFVQKIKQKLL